MSIIIRETEAENPVVTFEAIDTQENQRVGSLVVRFGQQLRIVEIGTVFSHRRQGIGTALLRRGVNLAFSRGITELWGGTSENEETTLAWYKKRGIEVDQFYRLTGRISTIREKLGNY